MTLDTKDFQAPPGDDVNLRKRPTHIDPVYTSKAQYETLLEAQVAKLRTMQLLHYAANTHAILLILQGTDTAGKDGVIAHVMSGVNPQGCRVYSYKAPTEDELEHDFLWRTTRNLPERGRIAIFNRSYYEETLVVRVHPEILKREAIPDAPRHDKKVWRERFRSINDFEKHLHVNGTRVVKIFLHLSKSEQKVRLLERIDDPEKNWKFSDADMKERAFWDDYARAFEDCLTATNTGHAPWYIVPADDKNNARLIVARVLLDTFERLDMSYPETSAARRAHLRAIREELTTS